jgi:hypothetical protein
MTLFLVEQMPRLLFTLFSVYCLLVVVTRWQSTRVMTQDRRFLLLFFILENVTVIVSGVLKMQTGIPTDVGTWLSVLMQSFLAAYLHHSIPAEFRRWHHRYTRRHLRR